MLHGALAGCRGSRSPQGARHVGARRSRHGNGSAARRQRESARRSAMCLGRRTSSWLGFLLLEVFLGTHCGRETTQGQLCDSGLAGFKLGVMYDQGSGVKTDEQRAAGLFKQACDARYSEPLASTSKPATAVMPAAVSTSRTCTPKVRAWRGTRRRLQLSSNKLATVARQVPVETSASCTNAERVCRKMRPRRLHSTSKPATSVTIFTSKFSWSDGVGDITPSFCTRFAALAAAGGDARTRIRHRRRGESEGVD